MYPILLMLHSILRWLVLIAGLLAAGKAIAGWLGRGPWTRLDDRLGLSFIVSLDVQLLLGLILYVLSPLTLAAFQDFGAAMRDPGLRFFALEHAFWMIVGIVLAHVGRALSRRTAEATGRHQRAAILFGLALLAILWAIPWPWLEGVGRPLDPFRFFGG